MTSAQLEEALGLTLMGVGAAFLVMVLLMVLILGTAWVFGTPFIQRRTGAFAAKEASSARRNVAMAAAIAVSAALAAGELTSHQDAQGNPNT